MKKKNSLLGILFAFFLLLAGCNNAATPNEQTTAPKEQEQQKPATELILATTTSLQDSGLYDALLPVFEEKENITMKVVAQGTGAAIETAKNGDADVLFVHDRASEDAFVSEGYGEYAWDVMWNSFYLVGPADDPAGIKGESDMAAVMEKLRTANAPFVSRGDDSGTHKRELKLWGDQVPAGENYIAAGAGMGDTIIMANEKSAYTLTDEATFLSMKDKLPNLEEMVKDLPELLNEYGVMIVSSTEKKEAAQKFVDFVVSDEAKEIIANYGMDQYGKALFQSDIKQR